MANQPTSGRSSPIGATIDSMGVNFCLFSRHATGVELLLFDGVDDARPQRVIALDPSANRTYHYWHIHVPGVRAGQLYAYRVQGPREAGRVRFDSDKVLLDPYGRAAVVPRGYSRAAAAAPGDNAAQAMKSAVVDPSLYNWENDAPLRLPAARTIIYELHVRGFTQHASSKVHANVRGTYAGLIQKIPYLQSLGITAVELMPVFHYDPHDCAAGKLNYWGYSPIGFFCPHPAYSSRHDVIGPVDEFRDMVKALHRAGIEVILDVVFNHTAEGNEHGPTLSLRGIDNPTYYILTDGGEHYANYTGCGNTLNANQPIVRRMILDSLRYWVTQMHVDGFRFDLASILGRDTSGQPLPQPPILWDIESDPDLAGVKLLAEAWDAAGLYQVGSFIGDAWREWNGRFRDDVRDFFRTEPGSIRRLADRLIGSPSVYEHEQREVEQSINFVTCHDGFTLNDLVTYNQKHNDDNGENGRDGCDDNRSWNCGIEGPSDDPAVEALRNRQVKNFLAATLLSLGVPMIGMGDEVRRTQLGNNNAYCQDNQTSWFDWSLLKKHEDVLRFVTLLNERRVLRTDDHERNRLSLSTLLSRAVISWHGLRLNQPDWSDPSHCLAIAGELRHERLAIHLMFNASHDAQSFELPTASDQPWRRWIDTTLSSPHDITPWLEAPPVPGCSYVVQSHAVALLYRHSRPQD
jgi:glycogen operon protein